MERLKNSWFRVPRRIRRPIVIVIGFTFVVAAGLTGWLPGPGGIPLFLVGVAILATEYEWAERLRTFVLDRVKWFGQQYRAYPIAGNILVVIGVVCAVTLGYTMYRFMSSL